MPLDPAAFLALASQCAPGVAPETLLAVARVESGLNPLAIGVNAKWAARPKPRSIAEAVAAAQELIASGRDIDLGLAQINVRNLPRLGLSLEGAFDPCRNLAASARVLREGYAAGMARHGPGQGALRTALSYYNTGHPQRGFRNGYVARVLAHAAAPVRPATAGAAADADPPPTPAWDVFARATAAFVVSPQGAPP